MLDSPQPSDGVCDPDAVSQIRVGDEAVYYGHSMCANCRVEFVGTIKDKVGVYYGIVFDAPIGMNDGSVDSVQYFKCDPKHGLFVKNYRLKLVSDMPPPSGAGGIWSKLIKNVDVGNRVVVNGGLEGHVMTIFQWFSEERRANKPVMVGILLEKKKGNSDGVYMGVRHFTCEYGRAIFVESFEIRPSSRPNAPESGNLSRTNSVRSVNSMASEWRAPGAYFGGSRVVRSPGLGPRVERPGLRSQLAVRHTTMLSSRPSLAPSQSDSSDKREIASLKNIVEELSKEQSRVELESRQYLQQYEKKCDELAKAENELQTLRSDFEGLKFEMLEVHSLLNTLGVDSPDSGDGKPTSNLLTRTARIFGLLCRHASSSCAEEKERLTMSALFKMFMNVPAVPQIGKMAAAINSFESALRSAEKVVPRIIQSNVANTSNTSSEFGGPNGDFNSHASPLQGYPATSTQVSDLSTTLSSLHVGSPQQSPVPKFSPEPVLK